MDNAVLESKDSELVNETNAGYLALYECIVLEKVGRKGNGIKD